MSAPHFFSRSLSSERNSSLTLSDVLISVLLHSCLIPVEFHSAVAAERREKLCARGSDEEYVTASRAGTLRHWNDSSMLFLASRHPQQLRTHEVISAVFVLIKSEQSFDEPSDSPEHDSPVSCWLSSTNFLMNALTFAIRSIVHGARPF